ncbi:MAG: hypothetical protein KDK71_06060 [Chlamydiia bacterium]|nr:hypothetical protein [Chlamydiia bacterium]
MESTSLRREQLVPHLVRNQPREIIYTMLAQVGNLPFECFQVIASQVGFDAQDFWIIRQLEKKIPRENLQTYFTAFPNDLETQMRAAIAKRDWDYLNDILCCGIALDCLSPTILIAACDFALENGKMDILYVLKNSLPPTEKQKYKNLSLLSKSFETASLEGVKAFCDQDDPTHRYSPGIIGSMFGREAKDLNFEIYHYLVINSQMGLDLRQTIQASLMHNFTAMPTFLKTLRDHAHPMHQESFYSLMDTAHISENSIEIRCFFGSLQIPKTSLFTEAEWTAFLHKRKVRFIVKVTKAAACIFSLPLAAHYGHMISPTLAQKINLISQIGLRTLGTILPAFLMNPEGSLDEGVRQLSPMHNYLALSAAIGTLYFSSSPLGKGFSLIDRLFLSAVCLNFFRGCHSNVFRNRAFVWMAALSAVALQLFPTHTFSLPSKITMAFFTFPPSLTAYVMHYKNARLAPPRSSPQESSTGSQS